MYWFSSCIMMWAVVSNGGLCRHFVEGLLTLCNYEWQIIPSPLSVPWCHWCECLLLKRTFNQGFLSFFPTPALWMLELLSLKKRALSSLCYALQCCQGYEITVTTPMLLRYEMAVSDAKNKGRTQTVSNELGIHMPSHSDALGRRGRADECEGKGRGMREFQIPLKTINYEKPARVSGGVPTSTRGMPKKKKHFDFWLIVFCYLLF